MLHSVSVLVSGELSCRTSPSIPSLFGYLAGGQAQKIKEDLVLVCRDWSSVFQQSEIVELHY